MDMAKRVMTNIDTRVHFKTDRKPASLESFPTTSQTEACSG